MWLSATAILKVEQWDFLMDWLWVVGEKELVTLVYYPAALQLWLRLTPSKK